MIRTAPISTNANTGRPRRTPAGYRGILTPPAGIRLAAFRLAAFQLATFQLAMFQLATFQLAKFRLTKFRLGIILLGTFLSVIIRPVTAPASSPTPSAARPVVLIIESYHAEYPWDISYKEGLREVLGDAVEFVSFEMDTKRLPAADHPEMAEKAWQRYRQVSPRLVILGDDNAVRLLADRFRTTDTPVVFLGLNRNPRDYGLARASNITGVLERPLLRRSIVMVDDILSANGRQTRKILVLFDSGTTSQVILDEEFHGRLRADIRGIEVHLRLIGKKEEWTQTVSAAADNGFDAIVVGLYHTLTDEDGHHADPEALIRWTAANAPAPPFGFWDFSVGADMTIGGLVLFGRIQGQMAGQIAARILSGESPEHIRPVTAEKGRLYFSRAQLEKWRMSLPPSIERRASFAP